MVGFMLMADACFKQNETSQLLRIHPDGHSGARVVTDIVDHNVETTELARNMLDCLFDRLGVANVELNRKTLCACAVLLANLADLISCSVDGPGKLWVWLSSEKDHKEEKEAERVSQIVNRPTGLREQLTSLLQRQRLHLGGPTPCQSLDRYRGWHRYCVKVAETAVSTETHQVNRQLLAPAHINAILPTNPRH